MAVATPQMPENHVLMPVLGFDYIELPFVRWPSEAVEYLRSRWLDGLRGPSYKENRHTWTGRC